MCLLSQLLVMMLKTRSRDRLPRYPAAAPGVIGVGALSGEGVDLASYSNFCDEPPSEGFMTLGGEPGTENGILGVYIHEFPVDNGSNDPDYHVEQPQPGHLRGPADYSPDLSEIQYNPNLFGWAWWAGTSFATPIISGLLAAAWRNYNWQGGSDAKIFLDGASSTNRTIDEREGY